MANESKTLSLEEKRVLSHIYNQVNKDIYGFGVNQLKIERLDNMIIILAKHQRVLALKALEKHHFELKRSVDCALYSEFKIRFKENLEAQLKFKIFAILRDYDPDTEIACTMVVLE